MKQRCEGKRIVWEENLGYGIMVEMEIREGLMLWGRFMERLLEVGKFYLN